MSYKFVSIFYSLIFSVYSTISAAHNPWQLDSDAEQSPKVGYVSPAPSWGNSSCGLSTSSRRDSVANTPGANISPELPSQRAASVSPMAQPLPPARVGCDSTDQGHETPIARENTATPSAFASADDAAHDEQVLVYMTPQQYTAWRSWQLNHQAARLQDELYSVVRSVLWGKFAEFRNIFYGKCPNGGQYCEPTNLLAFFDFIKPRLTCLPENLGRICLIVNQLIAAQKELVSLGGAFFLECSLGLLLLSTRSGLIQYCS